MPARGSESHPAGMVAKATVPCGCKHTCMPLSYSIHTCTHVHIDNAPASARLCGRKLQRALVVSGRNCPAPGETSGNSISTSPPSQSHQGQLPSTQWVYSASFPRGTYGSACFNHCWVPGSNVCSPPIGGRSTRPRPTALDPPTHPLLVLQPCLSPVSSKGCPSVCLHPNPLLIRTPV